jgi:SnoaL-like domain
MELAPATAGYQASQAEVDEVLAWFDRYDQLVSEKNLDGMADMAAFPINEVTDDGAGNGVATSCDRDRFVAQMQQQMAGGGELQITSTRHPIFLSPELVFVITDAEVTGDGFEQQMRYGDLLIKVEGRWLFQTMVGSGWGSQM